MCHIIDVERKSSILLKNLAFLIKVSLPIPLHNEHQHLQNVALESKLEEHCIQQSGKSLCCVTYLKHIQTPTFSNDHLPDFYFHHF